jgi:hypothetical protein
LILLVRGGSRPFADWLLAFSILHHALTYLVLRKVYRMSVPRSRYVAWFPVANLVIDWILIKSIRMCLTGQVTWRGTVYGARKSAVPPPVSKPATPA